MDVHLPKPLHGWREFVGEVGIIVLGVLIALGAEQVAETIHGLVEAKYARQAIRTELETNMARLRSRAMQRPCVQRRLREIQALLDGPLLQKGFESPKWVGRPQLWTMQTARWDAVSQAGRVVQLSPEELAQYGLMYIWMRNINSQMVAEQADWSQLRVLEHVPAPTRDMIFDLNREVQDARYADWRVSGWIEQLEEPASKLKLRRIANDLKAPRSICLPIDTSREQALRLLGSNDEP
jgi:hypothetical protein